LNKYNFRLNLTPGSSDFILLERVRANTRVLEFGPAYGRMTQYLFEQKSCSVYCVELDAAAAGSCRHFCEQILIGNIESYEWLETFKTLQFDHIIFADVLEHLYNPWKVLDSCKSLLKPDGSIIISIPNTSHNAIILNLMQDNFNYYPTGLLDNTHIRFFTKSSLDKMVYDSGYGVVFESAFYLDPLNTEFKISTAGIPESVASYLSNRLYGNVYQFIFEIQKREFLVSSGKTLESCFVETYECVLYLDSGQGFREEESIRTRITGSGSIRFSSDRPVKGFRLDPIDRPCSMEIKSIILIINGEITKPVTQSVNASFRDNSGKYVFYHNDPQIFLTLAKEIKGLTEGELFFDLEITLMPLSYSLFEAIQAQLTNTENELTLAVTELSKTASELTKKKNELSRTTSELSETKQELKNIFASYSWRLTKPLRLIKRKFITHLKFLFISHI
jgi:2-polyprenyl-3-methyl-5-hydroxy-6-metoxy-1,4-benzoquinol methylase